jgi:hypothetical protein
MAESASQTGTERRTEGRFLPTPEFELILKPSGLSGLLGGNPVQHWSDVSEGGLQAIISRKTRPGDVFKARIVQKNSGKEYAVPVSAKHISESQRYPGSFVVGFRFVDPPAQLRSFIVQSFGRNPAPPRAFSSPRPGDR